MIFLRSFARLSFRKIGKVLLLILSHPLFSILSFFATVKTFTLAKKYFPETNSTDGIGNAFRHALWTCLIMMYCCKISSPKKAAFFCKRATDLHEEIFPNLPVQTQMDLHNNKVGMDLFFKMLPGIHRQFFETGFFIDALLEKVKTAKILIENSEERTDELVYLMDKP